MTVILFVKTVLTPPGRLKDTDEAAERVRTGPVEDLVPLNVPELKSCCTQRAERKKEKVGVYA